jgi:hypothetical protein
MKPTAQIVCWNCRRGDLQLFNVKDSSGKKTPDYICVNCKETNYYPPILNMSKVYFPTDEKKVVTLEGDPVV